MTKKGRQLFQAKIGATPSVDAPGDTNPSDATDHCCFDFVAVVNGALFNDHNCARLRFDSTAWTE